MTRPHVEFSPCMRFGRAHIRGIPVDSIVESHWAGDDTAHEFDLTLAELLVACWFVARHGTRTWRRRWHAWVERVEQPLWRDDYDVDLPPTREDAK